MGLMLAITSSTVKPPRGIASSPRGRNHYLFRMQTASGTVRVAVESSSVTSVGFDAAVSLMDVEFAGGSVYRYFAVSAVVHAALMDASSKGAFFSARVVARARRARVGREVLPITDYDFG